MNITKIITSKSEFKVTIVDLLKSSFELTADYSSFIYDNWISKHVDQLIDTLWILIETPYIDKVYRDSYYTYFSTKLYQYKRDCFRLSFFDREIRSDEFYQEKELEDLGNSYLGFMVIRPTEPNVIGRSVISPKALKNSNFLSIDVPIKATVNSIKFEAVGFPHSSQDTETITCAETTLWAIMEYFGNKYAEYRPVLPSRIINTLKQISTERQLPSNGLNIRQLGFALKEFGFGTKIYSRDEFGNREFERLLSTYVESGIPIILTVENRPVGNIGHAVIAAGHEKISDILINDLQRSQELNKVISTQLSQKNISLYDNDDIRKRFVIIDDNQPIYQLAFLDEPTKNYYDPAWHNCSITYFLVPLYPKIYLEAHNAKSYFLNILLNLFPLPSNSEVFIRFFLSSSRSFKQELALKTSFNQTLKDLILEIQMPKFIWVGEISTKEDIKKRQANGIVLLDATEANMVINKVLLAAAFRDVYISYDMGDKWIKKHSLSLEPFNIFTSNLKGY